MRLKKLIITCYNLNILCKSLTDIKYNKNASGEMADVTTESFKDPKGGDEVEEMLPSPDEVPFNFDSRDKMKKNITVLRGIALVVGTVIGTGIFITPNSITRRVGAPATSILIWLAGGVIAAVGGLVFCELGTMIPVSGAEVAYLRKMYGPLPGFLSVWLMHFLLGGMRRAIGVLGFSKYLWSMFYENPETEVNWWVSKLVALIVLYTIVALITTKPTLILKCIVLFTTSKFVAMIIIIIAGFVYQGKGNTANISIGFEGTNTDSKEWGMQGMVSSGPIWAGNRSAL